MCRNRTAELRLTQLLPVAPQWRPEGLRAVVTKQWQVSTLSKETLNVAGPHCMPCCCRIVTAVKNVPLTASPDMLTAENSCACWAASVMRHT